MAKASTLTGFPGSSLPASWTAESQGTVTVAGSVLTFSAINGPSDDMYDAINSAATYDATACAVFVHVAPNTTVTQADTGFGYWDPTLTNGWTMGVVVNGVTGGVTSAYVQKWVNNNFTFVWSATYNATSHAWMQISESGGTLSFQVSATGLSGSWTTVYSTTSESITGGGETLSLSSCTVECYFGFQDNTKRSGSTSFSSFNIAPSPPPATVSPPSPPILGMYETSGAFPTPGPSAWPSGPTTNLSATYQAWGQDFPTYGGAFITKCNSNGLIPFVELEPWESGSSWNVTPLFSSITGGTWDTWLTGIGTFIAGTGKPCILTFAHEMNVSGQYPWSQGDTGSGPGGGTLTAAEWIAGWAYVKNKINSTANGYALWMWACSAFTGGTNVSPAPWWPSSALPDMVGIDGYPNTEYGSSLGTFTGQIEPTVTIIRGLGWTKPIYISETNLAQMVASGGESITSFVADMYTAGISGILEFEDAAWGLPQMTSTQWTQYLNAVAANYGAPGGGTPGGLLMVGIA